jgi:hypothetical protein
VSIDANQIVEALAVAAGNCIWCKELSFAGGARRCDFWKLEPQPSKGYRATAYEVKISRGDFKRDSHKKQREARLYSDKFYYVTPPTLLKPDEVPDWAGLIEFDGNALRKIVDAPLRDKDMPSWELMVSVIRYNGEIRRDVGQQEQVIKTLRWRIERAKEKIAALGMQPWEFHLG